MASPAALAVPVEMAPAAAAIAIVPNSFRLTVTSFRGVNQQTIMWVLVVFFGGTVLFGGLRRLTEDESTGVVVAVQLGALAVVVTVVVLIVRRLR